MGRKRKFTNEQAEALRTRYAGGESMKSLSAAFACSMVVVWRIASGTTYPEAGGPIRVPRKLRPR